MHHQVDLDLLISIESQGDLLDVLLFGLHFVISVLRRECCTLAPSNFYFSIQHSYFIDNFG
jgi:hypothetical protein